jgi:hypothetical protein
VPRTQPRPRKTQHGDAPATGLEEMRDKAKATACAAIKGSKSVRGPARAHS